MIWSLLNCDGQRKYLTPDERVAFMEAAFRAENVVGSFCLTLAFTGARISEALALTAKRLDAGNCTIVFETLKRRQKGIFRAVPVPSEFISYLVRVHGIQSSPETASVKLWTFSRPTAWKYVKAMMRDAHVPAFVAKPKALRHAFGVEAVQQRIALSVIKKWLGHAKIETTALYAEPVGREERALARLMWPPLPQVADLETSSDQFLPEGD